MALVLLVPPKFEQRLRKEPRILELLQLVDQVQDGPFIRNRFGRRGSRMLLLAARVALAHPTKRDSREDAFSVLDGWYVFGTVSWDLVLRVLEFHEKGLISLHDEVPSQEEGAEHHP